MAFPDRARWQRPAGDIIHVDRVWPGTSQVTNGRSDFFGVRRFFAIGSPAQSGAAEWVARKGGGTVGRVIHRTSPSTARPGGAGGAILGTSRFEIARTRAARAETVISKPALAGGTRDTTPAFGRWVPGKGLEPLRPRGHQLLRLACLPIPPTRLKRKCPWQFIPRRHPPLCSTSPPAPGPCAGRPRPEGRTLFRRHRRYRGRRDQSPMSSDAGRSRTPLQGSELEIEESRQMAQPTGQRARSAPFRFRRARASAKTSELPSGSPRARPLSIPGGAPPSSTRCVPPPSAVFVT